MCKNKICPHGNIIIYMDSHFHAIYIFIPVTILFFQAPSNTFIGLMPIIICIKESWNLQDASYIGYYIWISK